MRISTDKSGTTRPSQGEEGVTKKRGSGEKKIKNKVQSYNKNKSKSTSHSSLFPHTGFPVFNRTVLGQGEYGDLLPPLSYYRVRNA